MIPFPQFKAEAKFCAELSLYAYQDSGPLEQALASQEFGLNTVLYNRETDTHGFIALSNTGTRVAVGFRGTAAYSIPNWNTNFDIELVPVVPGSPLKIPRGFKRAYESIEAALLANLLPLIDGMGGPSNLAELVFTGHSLGAVLATYAALSIAQHLEQKFHWRDANVFKMYNFGAPPSGNAAFVATYAGAKFRSFRIMNPIDPVPEGLGVMTKSRGYFHVENRFEVPVKDITQLEAHSMVTYALAIAGVPATKRVAAAVPGLGFAQSRGAARTFELVVPTADLGVFHYYRDNDTLEWHGPTAQFGEERGSVAAASLIYSNASMLEVVLSAGQELFHFWRGKNGHWNQSPGRIMAANDISGAPSFAQARGSRGGDFWVLAPQARGGVGACIRVNDGKYSWLTYPSFATALPPALGVAAICSGTHVVDTVVVTSDGRLTHFYWNKGEWYQAGRVGGEDAPAAIGTPGLVQSGSKEHANFEIVVPLASGGFAHYYRDQSSQTWHGPTAIFGQDLGTGSVAQLIYSRAEMLEVVVCAGPIVTHFYRNHQNTWLQSAVIASEAI